MTLNEFSIDRYGHVSGSVQNFTTQVGGMALAVSQAAFNNEGLVVNGVLDLPNSVDDGSGSSTLGVTGLSITRDGVNFDEIVPSNYNLDIGGMTATIDHATITNKGIKAFGQVQIPSDVTPEPILFTGIVITENGIEGGQIDVTELQNLHLGPAYFNMHNAVIEMVNNGTEIKPVISIEYAELRLDASLNEDQSTIRVEELVISNEGVFFRRGQVMLPTVTAGHFTIKEARVEIERQESGGYIFTGEGTLVVQQLAPGTNNTAITAMVSIYLDGEQIRFREAELGIRGPRIPLGNTGAFITGLWGRVDFNQPDAIEFQMTIDLEAGPRVGELVALNGQVGTTINLAGWMRLEGNMKLFTYEISQVSLSINEPGVSDNGVRGSVHLDLFAIVVGNATVYVYVDAWGEPAIEGSAEARVQIPLEVLIEEHP